MREERSRVWECELSASRNFSVFISTASKVRLHSAGRCIVGAAAIETHLSPPRHDFLLFFSSSYECATRLNVPLHVLLLNTRDI